MLRWRLPGLPRDPIADRKTGLIPRVWASWFQAIAEQVDAASFRLQTVTLDTQAAAIVPTNIPIASLTTGLYRVTYALRVTQAASTSSSVAVTLSWKSGGVACSQAFGDVTGNTTDSVQSGTVLIRCDVDGPITYAVAYASVGLTAMQYSLDVAVEVLPGVST